MARPTKYDPKFCKIAKKMTELGATDNDVAEALDIGTTTLYRWRNEHPEFRDSLKVGKSESDERVEMSLYRRAVGYTHEAVKIFQFQGQELIVPYTEVVQPDTTACIFWLKNRMPEKYRANPEPDGGEDGDITIRVTRAAKPE